MRQEQSQVHFGKTAIDYAIERGRRQKTAAIAVDPVEGVRVRALKDTPVEKLDDIVQRKAKWIIDRRRRHEDLPPAPMAREFVSGETFLYLGRQHRLKLDRRVNGEGRVRLVGGRLVVPAGGGAGPQAVRDRLVAWYRAHAAERLPERVGGWASKMGLEPEAVLISDQRKRWGSADAKGNVRPNWRVVQAPAGLVDYVIVHELAHLEHADHTRDFWATVGRAIPDYEARREALRRLGRMMTW